MNPRQKGPIFEAESALLIRRSRVRVPLGPPSSGNSAGIQPAPANPRALALAVLYEQASALAAAGDLAGARALHDAIGAMLGGDGAGGAVVDLAARRGRP